MLVGRLRFGLGWWLRRGGGGVRIVRLCLRRRTVLLRLGGPWRLWRVRRVRLVGGRFRLRLFRVLGGLGFGRWRLRGLLVWRRRGLLRLLVIGLLRRVGGLPRLGCRPWRCVVVRGCGLLVGC